MDNAQVLTIAMALLAVILAAVGVYVLLVLRDFRETVSKLNRILGRVDSITEHVDTNIIRPTTSLAGILAVLRDGARVVSEIKHLSTDVKDTVKVASEEAKEVAHVVKDALPEVTDAAKDVLETAAVAGDEAWKDARDVIATAKEGAEEVVAEISTPEPTPDATSRRRHFTKRR